MSLYIYSASLACTEPKTYNQTHNSALFLAKEILNLMFGGACVLVLLMYSSSFVAAALCSKVVSQMSK